MRKVILYISMSLDGYIAREDGDISFLDEMEQAGEDYGYAEFCKTVDTVIIGRKSFDKVISMGYQYPHTDKEVFIVSGTRSEGSGPFKYYSGPLKDLVEDLKSLPGKDIYCDGGSLVANQLMEHDLIDEFIISVVPVMLGDGIRLFRDGRPEIKIQLTESKKFKSGLIQLHYKRL
jgi:dihydrofolate reductase